MTESEQLRQQLAEIEAHLSHQDLTLQGLNDNAAKQWETIEKLEQTVRRLQERLTALGDSGGSAASDDEPPPHY